MRAISNTTPNREVITFCDHWKQATDKDPHMLVTDQKLTTQTVLAELDQHGDKFLTLPMRSPPLLHQINNPAPAHPKTITLNRPDRYNHPRIHESTVGLSKYPDTLHQSTLTGLGRDTPTIVITNHTDTPAKQLLTHYKVTGNEETTPSTTP